MKANEFVKIEGLQVFKYALAQLSFMPEMFLVVYHYECEFVYEIKPNHGNLVFSYEQVKRLVESHELVEKMGGTMDELKEHVRVVERNLARSVYFKCTIERNIKRIDRIKQAIVDVESCQ